MMNKNLIKHFREAMGISQAELARKVSLTQQAISRYENGTRMPSIITALRIVSVLGVSIEQLEFKEVRPLSVNNQKAHL